MKVLRFWAWPCTAVPMRTIKQPGPAPAERVQWVEARGRRVTAVLDWGNSLAGDPLYDLAWLLYWVRWHTGWDERVIRSAAGDLLDGADVEERLRCYQLHIALAAQQYSAFVGRPAEVTWNADQIRDLLSG
jgi:aminoglycoside phosphotransferase (APT) family kinase protein